MPPDDRHPVSRRSVIAGAALIPAARLSLSAQPKTPAAVFSLEQKKTLEAFLDRLVPKDELGPGAVECGVADYIERSLAGAIADEKESFLDGLAGMDAFAHRAHGASFAGLPVDKQDAVLMAMERGSAEGFDNARGVFARFRRLALEGMFGDPYYGGNRSFAGWDLIRYPGPRVAVSADEQRLRAEVKPYRRSAYGEKSGR